MVGRKTTGASFFAVPTTTRGNRRDQPIDLLFRLGKPCTRQIRPSFPTCTAVHSRGNPLHVKIGRPFRHTLPSSGVKWVHIEPGTITCCSCGKMYPAYWPCTLAMPSSFSFFSVAVYCSNIWLLHAPLPRGGVRADALGSALQVHVGRFWGPLGGDTFLVSDLGGETGFGLLSPS